MSFFRGLVGFIFTILLGALAWWGLCFIPAVSTFDENSHQQIIEWATPSDETPDTEEPDTEEPGNTEEDNTEEEPGTEEPGTNNEQTN